MSKGYTAYVIDPASRAALLETFVPKYPDVVAHHITHKFGATEDDLPADPKTVKVVGCHDSGAIQVLVAEVDGQQNQETVGEGERFYHITLALDRAQGVAPKDSNTVLQDIAAARGIDALRNLPEPIEIKVSPKFLQHGGKPKPKVAGKVPGKSAPRP